MEKYKGHLYWNLFLQILFIRESENKQGGGAEGEGADPPLNREPDVGFHPRTLGS